MNRSATDRVFSELDHARITRLGASLATDPLPAIFDVLDDGELVAPRDMPADVVSMYSRVIVRMGDDSPLEVTICYPQDADPAKACYSVLSPIGGALLGLRVGDVAEFTSPDGKTTRLRVEKLEYQPEAAGNYVR